jgi:hypothetical protein
VGESGLVGLGEEQEQLAEATSDAPAALALIQNPVKSARRETRDAS